MASNGLGRCVHECREPDFGLHCSKIREKEIHPTLLHNATRAFFGALAPLLSIFFIMEALISLLTGFATEFCITALGLELDGVLGVLPGVGGDAHSCFWTLALGRLANMLIALTIIPPHSFPISSASPISRPSTPRM
jgi:hypothetical protein